MAKITHEDRLKVRGNKGQGKNGVKRRCEVNGWNELIVEKEPVGRGNNKNELILLLNS